MSDGLDQAVLDEVRQIAQKTADALLSAVPPTSAAAWREKLTRTINFPDGLAIEYRIVDMLVLLDDKGDAPNLLMASLSEQLFSGKQQDMSTMTTDPKMLSNLQTMLRNIMTKVVINPPLIEQGHADGISVDQISLDKKMAVFEDLMGGPEAVQAARSFRNEQASPVVSS